MIPLNFYKEVKGIENCIDNVRRNYKVPKKENFRIFDLDGLSLLWEIM